MLEHARTTTSDKRAGSQHGLHINRWTYFKLAPSKNGWIMAVHSVDSKENFVRFLASTGNIDDVNAAPSSQRHITVHDCMGRMHPENVTRNQIAHATTLCDEEFAGFLGRWHHLSQQRGSCVLEGQNRTFLVSWNTEYLSSMIR